MIHDASAEVSCDYERCHKSVFIPLEWVYGSYNESSGHYDSSDSKIEEKLVDEDWVARDGKHYCPFHAEMME